MRAIVLALVVAAAVLGAAPAQAQWGGGWGGASPPFRGGELTQALVLDATNTLCSQALSLSFEADADTGIQRNAANTWLICAGAVAALTITSTAVTAGVAIRTTADADCADTDIGPTGVINRGIAFESGGSNRTFFCAGGNPYLTIGSTTITMQSAFSLVSVGTGAFTHTGTAAGVNGKIYSAANAAGEYGITAGTDAALTGATLDTPIFSAGYDIDGTPSHVLIVQGSGHLDVNGATPSDFTSGTCTADTGTGDDFHGVVTADCTAQTAIVTFGRAYVAAPVCYVAVSTGLPTVLSWTTSTTALTITATAGAASKYTYNCWEP